MPYKLIIYIPTFNRLKKLQACIACIEMQIRDFIHDVKVVVSDNGSPDGTANWLENNPKDWLICDHFSENKGFYFNVLKGYDLKERADFVWIIGDDDYLFPGAISDLLSIIESNHDIDYIYCNTTAFNYNNEQEYDAIIGSYLRTGSLLEGSVKKCRKYVGTAKTTFEHMIDPDIADTLLGELMVSCFRQEKLRFSYEESLDLYNQSMAVENNERSIHDVGTLAQPHNVPYLLKFSNNTLCFFSDKPRTFNFWGSAEWLGNYDYVFPIIILHLILGYREKSLVSLEKYYLLLDYYFRAMNTSLRKQKESRTSAEAFSNIIKSEMFDVLFDYHFYKEQASSLKEADVNRRVFNIVVMSAVFNDISQCIGHGLNQLGHSVYYTQSIAVDAYNVIFGAHLISNWENIPSNSIIFNMEQLGSESHYLTEEGYIDKLRRYTVWDYSYRNIGWLQKNLKNFSVELIKIGHCPTLTKINPAAEQDIDVLFYGALNDRRLSILNQLKERGINVTAVYAYGNDLDNYIARSKVVLNCHYYSTMIFEIARVSYLLANSKAVVAEVNQETEIDADLLNAVFSSRYENLVDSCCQLVFDISRRKLLEEKGFDVFSRRNQAEYLRDAVNSLLQLEVTKFRNDPTFQALVSIIIPTFNRPELLRDAIQSVIAQTYPHWEAIVVNDAGVDVQEQIADLLQDSRVRYVRHENNKGPAGSRNTGLSLAQGEIICLLDDDDRFLPNHLEAVISTFSEPGSEFAYTNVRYVHEHIENGVRITLSENEPYRDNPYSRERLLVKNYIPINTWAFKRSLALRAGPFDEKIPAMEDWEYILRLTGLTTPRVIKETTVEVRMRPTLGLDQHISSREHWSKLIETYQRIYTQYKATSPDVQAQRDALMSSVYKT